MSEKNFNGLLILAERYAGAIFDLSKEKKCIEQIQENLMQIDETLKECSDLKMFLEHPNISKPQKKEIIKEIFQKAVSEYVLSFIFILVDKNRFFAFSAITKVFKKLVIKDKNILTAEVVTAIKLDKTTSKRIKDKLEKLYEKEVYLESKIDEDIIAGVIVKIGDKTIDGSVKTKLKNLKKQIIQR